MREGKYSLAIAKLKLATQQLADASQPRAWNHLGLAHHRAGQPSDAIAAYQHALRLSPNLAAARYNLGSLYLEQGNLPGAISELSAYTVLDPNSLPCWLKLGAALIRLKQFDEAEKCYRNALQLDAAHPEALNGMGVSLLQRKRWRDGLNYFTAALEKNSRYAPAILNVAIVYHQHFPNRQLALRRYREYLDVNPPPSNVPAVEEIVRQIEAEINPPVQVALTAPTNHLASPTNLAPVTRPATITNVVPQRPPVESSPPLVASSPPQAKPPLTKPLPPTDPPTSDSRLGSDSADKIVQRPASPPTSATNSPASVPAVREEPTPPVKLDVVTLTNDLPPKLPLDIAPAPTSPATNALAEVTPETTNVTSNVAAPLPPIASRVKPRNQGRSLLDRMNPVSWFRGREQPLETTPSPNSMPSDAPTVATGAELNYKSAPPQRPLAPPPSPPPDIPRYSYRQPPQPVAGDRGKAQPLFADGLQAHREQRLTAAIEAYRQAIRLDPSYYEAHYNLGLAAYQVKDLGWSLLAYEYALALKPDSVEARYNLALSLEQARFYRDAADELERLLAARGNETNAHYALAKLYAERLARIDLARMHYRRVLELDPRHPEAPAVRYWLAAHP